MITFYKYEGTGNDFIIIDNRTQVFNREDIDLVKQVCKRRTGVGADGLILLENHPDLDFNMIYFNADGSQSFCGNGSRCAVAFAKKLEIIKDKTIFNSTDGVHEATMNNNIVSLKMHDVVNVESGNGYFFINTGSPHYIQVVDDVSKVNVVEEGRKIRYNDRFKKEGTNVNFVELAQDHIKIRTYERGVEDETLSCGTGVTAAALASSILTQGQTEVQVKALGGNLTVKFSSDKTNKKFESIWLTGEVKEVFKGEIVI